MMLDMKAGRRWMARCRILISVLLIPGLSPAQVDKGASYANAITRHRPYQNKKQLSSRRVIPGAAYAKIKDLVIAKQ